MAEDCAARVPRGGRAIVRCVPALQPGIALADQPEHGKTRAARWDGHLLLRIAPGKTGQDGVGGG
jgi:hypothetical protein